MDRVIKTVSNFIPYSLSTDCSQIREYHAAYYRGDINTRDVIIVAHGHFNRALIARWNDFPLSLGVSRLRIKASVC